MILVPHQRLLLWALIAAMGLAIGGLIPSAMKGVIVILVVFTSTVLLDAWRNKDALRGITAQTPEVIRLSKDREGQFAVYFTNESQLAKRLRVVFSFPKEIKSSHDSLDVRLPSQTPRTSISWTCKASTRGRYRLDRCYFETTSSLGFWNIRGHSPLKTEIRVYPNLWNDRKMLAALFLNRGGAGISLKRMIGQGREFEKLREYVAGDSFDQIHWKATARKRKPITKVFQIEKTQEIYVAIDFSRLSGRPSRQGTLLERFVTAALVLGLAAEQQGDAFGCLSYSDHVQNFTKARTGKNHFSACREALFRLQPQTVSPDFEEICIFIRPRLHKRALLFFLTDFSDPILTESILKHIQSLARQHLIVFGILDSPENRSLFESETLDSVDALYRRLGGHLLWHQLREISKKLHHQGVHVLPLRDEAMSVELVTQYLTIKSRQLL
jgi:uncharacterized protein (DUF58 family)